MKDRTAPRQPLRTLRPASDPIVELVEDAPVEPSPAPTNTPSLPVVGEPRRVPLDLIDDSPYQPRLSYNPEKIDELAKGLAAAGQQEPVILREKVGGRYELISGHRRKRAAMSIGWTDINSDVKRYSDAEAQKATLIQNEGRADLTDYERAKMFKQAMEHGFAKTQTECAELFSTSQSIVSRCITMLDLPVPILELVERQPELISVGTATIIRDLIKQYPDRIELITKGVERLRDGAEATSLRGWIAQMIAGDGRTPVQTHRYVIANSGAPVYEMRRKPGQRDAIVTVKDDGEDLEEFDKWLVAALEQRNRERKS